MPTISVVFPVYLPSDEHRKMTDKNLSLAKNRAGGCNLEWVIVETASDYYLNEADLYLHERVKTTSGASINRAFGLCTGDYVAYLSNDVTVCDDWISKMLACFDKADCGIASLGNNEHGDVLSDKIVESFYFSVAMLRKCDAWYTTEYKSNFLDTDLAFRLHLQGKKFYKNLSGIVYHKPHSTVGKYSGDLADYERCRQHFADKYKEHASDPLYKKFAGVL